MVPTPSDDEAWRSACVREMRAVARAEEALTPSLPAQGPSILVALDAQTQASLMEICGHLEIDMPSAIVKAIAEMSSRMGSKEDLRSEVLGLDSSDRPRTLLVHLDERTRESLAKISESHGLNPTTAVAWAVKVFLSVEDFQKRGDMLFRDRSGVQRVVRFRGRAES
jgi:hypothetical protein